MPDDRRFEDSERFKLLGEVLWEARKMIATMDEDWRDHEGFDLIEAIHTYDDYEYPRHTK